MSTSVQLERLIKVFETLKISRTFQTGSANASSNSATTGSLSGPGTGGSAGVTGSTGVTNVSDGGDSVPSNPASSINTGSPILALVSSAGRAAKKEALPVSRTDKLQSCSQFCECLLSSTLQNNADFPKYLSLTIEALMDLCDDVDHDVRIAADEAINKLIKSLPPSYINHLLFEFYKELKRRGSVPIGGPTRSLSLSLRKFSAMCHHIKASRRRSYVTNLLPCLAKLAAEREEEGLLDSFRDSLPRLCGHLLRYATDAEVKLFLKSFLPNLHSESIGVRRTAAQLIAVICQHARGPFAFLSWTLQLLIDMLVPVDEERPLATIHGVLVALRHAAAAHHSLISGEEVSEAGWKRRAAEESTCRAEQWASVLELCVFYTQAKDGSVTTAALEALQQLLRSPPPVLLPQMLHANGAFWRTSIYRPLSRHGSVSFGSLTRLPSADIPSVATPESEERQQLVGETPAVVGAPAVGESLALAASESSEDGPSTGTTESANSPVSAGPCDSEVDEDEEEGEEEEIKIPSLDKVVHPKRNAAPEEETTIISQPMSAKTLQEIPVRREGDLGQLCDPEHPPLLYCARLVAHRFLLTGNPGQLLPDRLVRASLKSLALSCLGQVAKCAPHLLCSALLKNVEGGKCQLLTDAFEYCRHDDPQVGGQAALMVSAFLEAVFRNSFHASDYQSWLRPVWDWEGSSQEPPSMETLLEHFTGHLFATESSNNATLHRSLVALKGFAASALRSPGSAAAQVLVLLERCLHLANNNYRLVRVALLDLFASLDFTQIAFVESQMRNSGGSASLWQIPPLQERVLDAICRLASEEDKEVTRAAADCLATLVPKLYFPTCTTSSSGCVTGMDRRLLCLTLATRHCPPLLRSLMSPNVWGHSSPPAPLFGTAQHLAMSPWKALNMADTSGLNGGAAFEASLQQVLHQVRHRLMIAANKEQVIGLISAFHRLATTYPPSWHPLAWSCRPSTRSLSNRECPFRSNATIAPPTLSTGQDLMLLEHCVCLLTSSIHLSDQTFHQELLSLSGELIAGFGLAQLIQTGLDDEKSKLNQTLPQPHINNGAQLSVDLSRILSALFRHVIRLLSIFQHVVEDQTPTPPAQEKKLVLTNPLAPPSALTSPVRSGPSVGSGLKRRAVSVTSASSNNQTSLLTNSLQSSTQVLDGTGKEGNDKKQSEKDAGKEEKESRSSKSRESIGQFYNVVHYMKLYESIKTAYKSYKISFELTKTDRTVSLLDTCLNLFCQLLELAGLLDLTKCVEEVLQYLRSVYFLLPLTTVQAMRQLLRALFGTNLVSQWDTDLCRIYEQLQSWMINVNPAASTDMGLTVMSLQLPYQQLSQVLQSSGLLPSSNTAPTFSLYSWLRYSGERRQPLILRPSVGMDKNAISSYIRLFEPLVILTLREYTSTSNAALQGEILALLSQLIHLRVNYCQLDADQRFLQIVRRQCEQLEESHTGEANLLAPALFNFLILLSYERIGHGSTLVAIPELLQLADGLLASGLDPSAAVLPVLQQIVADLFVRRSPGPDASASAIDELNSQREYLVSILLKLLHWPASLTPLRLVVEHAAGESEERWYRLSKQLLDALLPVISAGQLRVDAPDDLDALHALFAALSPAAFSPLEQLLQMMFGPPAGAGELPRWSATVLALLRVLLSHAQEEFILHHVSELQLTVQINKRSFASPLRQAISSCSASSTTPDWETQEAPETIFLRFCFQILGLLVSRIAENSSSATIGNETEIEVESAFCANQAVLMLFYLVHLFRENSPMLTRMLSGANQLCASEASRYYSVEDLNSLVFELRTLQPYLTAQWCHLMTRCLQRVDESWWSKILVSPAVGDLRRRASTGEFLLEAQQDEEGDSGPGNARNSSTLNEEMTRALAMTYYSASVIADGNTDGEKLSWLIVRHVYDIVLAAASGDPVMQDLVSAVHRNSSASVLFLQALQFSPGCDGKWKELHLTQCILRCVEGIHLSASGRLLALLFDRFLFTHCLALAKRAEVIACRRVEMLLLVQTECRGQLDVDEVDGMIARLPARRVRFEHLRSLLSRLRSHLKPPSDPLTSALPPAAPPSSLTGREWYLDRLRRHCCADANPRLCARLLQHLDYSDCITVMKLPEFRSAILEQCLRISYVRTQSRFNSAGARFSPTQPSTSAAASQVDKLFQAAELVLLQRIRTITSDEGGRGKRREVGALCGGLIQYLVILKQLPVPVQIPPEYRPDILRFVDLFIQQCLSASSSAAKDRTPPQMHIIDVLRALRLSLSLTHHPVLMDLLIEDSKLCILLVNTVYALVHAGHPHSIPHPSACPLSDKARQEGGHPAPVFRARWLLEQLMRNIVLTDRLRGGVGDNFTSLRCLLHVNIINLCRMPMFNSAVRGPCSRAGSPEEDGIYMASLIDRPLLEEFIKRISVLGWTSRKQFEEEWVSLLYPLNPPGEGLVLDEDEQALSIEELIERSRVVLTSMWGLTRLLLDTLGRPEPGNPVLSAGAGWEHRPRGKLPAFNHTRNGRRLSQVSGFLWEELDVCLHGERGPLNLGCPRGYRNDWNLERQANPRHYDHEQLNLEVLRRRLQNGVSSTAGGETLPGLLDVHSCLAFVPDLFAPWLQATDGGASLAVKTHAVRCAVALADLCSSNEQVEWLADALTALSTEETTLVRPALISGLAKLTAVLHNQAGGAPIDTITKLIESAIASGLKPTMSSVQGAALHGAMYLLQMETPLPTANSADSPTVGLLHDLHQQVVRYLERALLVLAGSEAERNLYSEAFWLTVLAASFFYCEQLSELLRETDLVSNLIQVCQQLGSSNECSLPIHVALFRGFERLLLTGLFHSSRYHTTSLPRLTVDVLVKLALDRLRTHDLCPVRALPTLNLFLACMYVSQQATPDHNPVRGPSTEAAEMRRLSILERTAVLYARMQRSAPLEARLLSRILPHVSLDFFSPEEVLNRTLRELVHPSPLYPDLTARLVFEAFRQLCIREHGVIVRQWTLLTVHNLAEMRPLEKALSSLSVAFLSCTEDVWLRGVFHFALSRLGCRASADDEECFLRAAVDFYRSLPSEQDKHSFIVTFRALAPHEPTFRKLDSALAAL